MMSFASAKQEVEEWTKFFESQGINLEVEEISVIAVDYPDDVEPQITEVGFEPVLVGETMGGQTEACKKSGMSYDEYFRIEEILTTGRYRWKASEMASIYEEKKVKNLSSAMTIVMLEEWAAHMRTNHIMVKWKLK